MLRKNPFYAAKENIIPFLLVLGYSKNVFQKKIPSDENSQRSPAIPQQKGKL